MFFCHITSLNGNTVFPQLCFINMSKNIASFWLFVCLTESLAHFSVAADLLQNAIIPVPSF